MSIKPVCDKCKQELNEFGAILFSPQDEDSQVEKMHLCVGCYSEMMEIVKNNF